LCFWVYFAFSILFFSFCVFGSILLSQSFSSLYFFPFIFEANSLLFIAEAGRSLFSIREKC